MGTLDLIGLAYLLVVAVMSAACFGLYGLDKRRARLNAARISESTLHLLAMLGGWPGALIGSRFFRHKTQKLLFILTTVAIVGCHVALIATWVWLRTRHSE